MREIVQDGAPVLREVALPMPEKLFGSAELARIIGDMEAVLDGQPEGVALAAPQIGVPYRIFIVREDRALPIHAAPSAAPGELPAPQEVLAPQVEVYINPEIVKTSRRRARMDEGCLSVKGVYGTTKRHERVTIRARRTNSSRFELGRSGIMAQIFEHEVDHLNGVLFTDHAERLLRIEHATTAKFAQQHSRTSEGAPRRFAYFGTPKVASDTLATLVERGFKPAVVVTAPDTPRGRGLVLAPSPVRALARTLDIPTLAPEKFSADVIAAIGAYGCDAALVVAYGKIFPKTLIDAFPLGMLNVHYSLLPKYRGATPLEAAFLAGERETGVTVQKITEELDAGDIVAQEAVEIASSETARELRARLVPLGARLLADVLPAFLSGGAAFMPQDASRASHTHKLKKEDGLLSLPAGGQDSPQQNLENWNKYRAYAGTIGTHFFEKGKRVKITSAEFAFGEFRVLRVIPEGKREIGFADFARQKADNKK